VRGRRIWPSALAAGSLLASLIAMTGCGAGSDAVASRGPRASFPGRDPSLRIEVDGTLHATYVVDEQPGGPAVFYRRLGPRPFEPVRVSPAGLSVKAHGETPPALEILPGSTLVVAYPVALPGKWKSEIRLQRSADGGAQWSAPELLHAERIGSHSYLSSAVTPAGEPVFAWLDDSTGRQGLHARRGAAPPVTLDPVACECCGTALLAGSRGEVWLAYRDADDDVRDFRVLRADGHGFDSGRPLSVDGWKIQGCPHTGARLAQAENGTLWATWFTAGDGQAGIYAASSADGGATFASRTLIAAAGPGRMVRHPELGTLPDGGLVVLYEAEKDGKQALMAQVGEPRTGVWEPPRQVAPGGSYPRWVRRGSATALAFTCQTGGGPQVVIADGAAVLKDGLAGFECEGSAASHSGH
jgi:hypothetical protein